MDWENNFLFSKEKKKIQNQSNVGWQFEIEDFMNLWLLYVRVCGNNVLDCGAKLMDKII